MWLQIRSSISSLVVFIVAVVLFTGNVQAQYTLIRPALESDKAIESLLLDITAAGERLVAAGERGHILYRDPGKQWQQAKVPVIAHLTAVDFPTPQQGYAVGHEGIILRSTDAGESWELIHHELVAGPQRAADKIPEVEAALEQAEEAGDRVSQEELEIELDDLYFLADSEEVPPLLDVYFTSADKGFAIGGYNLFLVTEDGGDSWSSQSSALPNPEGFHNNAIAQDADGRLFIAGERGRIYRSEDQGLSWDVISPRYDGSFFGLFTTSDGLLVATGLRGNLFISDDGGSSWEQPASQAEQTLNGGLRLGSGQLLIVGQNGEYLIGNRDQLQRHTLPGRYSLQAVASQQGDIFSVGRGGIHSLPLLLPSSTRQ
ncbi:WD40/YVTN/BNR-like repeat-containing protein [Marinospirillum sp.]|uniref:WD40/YVTN/BNR-like repeat-containing protein n=1 Tax=Marinospirillum sp. TaxID=2183934 RepID=UPI00384A4A35